MIRAPYNFVPINKKVYFPEWADKISQDMPFSDGKSGELAVKIQAESPIFVRNGQKSDSDDTSFSNINNKFFIPGTSIKGMIHSVLEIMSFSKMKQVDNRKFSWRDLVNPDYSSQFTQGFSDPPKVKAGFIKKENSEWYLIPADMARIEQCELHNDFGTRNGLLSSVEKYEFWEKKGHALTQDFEISDPGTSKFVKQCGKFRRAKFDPGTGSTSKRGTLVFTGQIKKRNNGTEGMHGEKNKHLEFVFFDKNGKNRIKIDKEMRKNFELNHSKERNIAHHKLALAPNEEWAHWKKKLNKGELMPVFWLPSHRGQQVTVSSFGLAMLYRLPFKNSVKDLLPDDHKKKELDMAEAIFGTIEKDIELKGRVQFSLAEAVGNVQESNVQQVILSNPKATFYPAYIWQPDNRDKYITYDNNLAELAGRKRYPVHQSDTPVNNFQQEQQKLSTKLKPLARGTEFEFKVRFHNLKPVELGALLSAITLHGNSTKLYHSIGMGKSLGYGKLKIKKVSGTVKDNDEDIIDIDKYLKLFEENINMALMDDNYWIESEQIKELFSMSKDQDSDTSLQYMQLSEFTTSKSNNEALPRYSSIAGNNSFNAETKADKQKIQDKKKKIRTFQSNINNSEGLEKIVNKIIFYNFLKKDISRLAWQGFEQFITPGKIGPPETEKKYWELAKASVFQYLNSLSDSDENYAKACRLVAKKSLKEIDDQEFIDKLSNIGTNRETKTDNNLNKIRNIYKKQLADKIASENIYARLLNEIEQSKDNNQSNWVNIYKNHIENKSIDEIKKDEYLVELVKKMQKITKKTWRGRKAQEKKKYFKKLENIVKQFK